MSLLDRFRDLDTGVQLLLGVGVLGVGLVLLVVVTVIVAAVLGTFVLGMGGASGSAGGSASASPAPNADWTFESDGGTVTVTHAGGDVIPASEVVVVVDGDTRSWPGSDAVTAGDTATVDAASGDLIRVVWASSDGDDSATLATYTVPG